MTPNKIDAPAGGDRIEISLPSDMRYLDLINRIFQESAAAYDFEKEIVEEIAQAALEAVTNAIEHGNEMVSERPVLISIQVDSESFWFQVSDQGKGFDFEHLKNPLDPENLLKTRGRGIFIMKAFMDSVDFDFTNNRGMTVTLLKTRHRENRSAEA